MCARRSSSGSTTGPPPPGTPPKRGARVDLPRLSTMIMGLDDWRLDHAPLIEEPRLLAQVRQEEGLGNVERFHGPPQTEDVGGLSFAALDAARLVGVPV